jgi:hypothetical protein
MACVIGLPDAECPAPVVDVIGAGEFVGYAGRVKADAPITDHFEVELPVRYDRLQRAALAEKKRITVSIRAPRLEREDGRYIPSRQVAEMYGQALIGEMSDDVKQTVSVFSGSIGHESAKKFSEDYPGKKAIVLVRGDGAATIMGMSFMFELRDAVVAVIERFEPPEGAWVADEKPLKTGDYSMENTENGQVQEAAAPVISVPAAPQLDMEAHVVPLAQAAASVHYPIEEIETRAVQYLNDAKQFIAMFNMALTLFQSIIPQQPQQPATPPVNPAP